MGMMEEGTERKMREVKVYYDDVFNPKTHCFTCLAKNDYQLRMIKEWFKGQSYNDSKPYPRYTIIVESEKR